jgi:LemA protein
MSSSDGGTTSSPTCSRRLGARGVAESGRAEGELSRALGSLFALAERYPDLKSNQNALQLQEELTSTENKIAFARQLYNDLVMRFNTKLQKVPANLVAGSFGFSPGEYFEIATAERETPKVDLSLR